MVASIFKPVILSNPLVTMSKMNSFRNSLVQVMAFGFLALACALLPACKPKEEEIALFPVSGNVTVGGKPLLTGDVQFYADESKGNNYKRIPTGHVSNGTYKLMTGSALGNKEGAPAGWYKVAVHAGSATSEELKSYKAPSISSDYQNPKKTKILIEVKEGADPKSYDIKIP
jgi:hypothetical protein